MARTEERFFCMRGLFCSWLVIFCTLQMSGQSSSTGEIRGTVTDPVGAVVVGAQVVVTNVATGEEKSFTTNRDGLYDTVSTQNGHYTVAIMAPGFEKLVLGPITLDIGTITLNGKLRVGSALQEVVVSADVAALLRTESGEQSTTFDEKTMQQLPQVGQDWRTLRSCCRAVRAHLRRAIQSPIPGRRFLSTAANPTAATFSPTAVR